jgi:exportin-1
MTIIINKVRDIITGDVPRILDAVFECTLSMITKNFEDYPEHRANFFHLLRAVNSNCFAAFFAMPGD